MNVLTFAHTRKLGIANSSNSIFLPSRLNIRTLRSIPFRSTYGSRGMWETVARQICKYLNCLVNMWARERASSHAKSYLRKHIGNESDKLWKDTHEHPFIASFDLTFS